jgi:uncharacterized protein YjbI with pentapeptide repeats
MFTRKKVTALFFIGSFFIINEFTFAKEKTEWSGKLADGSVIAKQDLSKIIDSHNIWLNSNEKDGERADLSETDLKEVDLQGVILRKANFSSANLEKANFKGADLRGAIFRDANLKSVYFGGANLEGATLNSANLYFASFRDANLSDVHFFSADLSNANLVNTDLSRAAAWGANFKKTWFEPSNMEGFLFRDAKNLSEIFFNYPSAVVQLRKISKEQGLRSEERALTSSLKKHSAQDLPIYVAVLEDIFLRFPSDYGAKPWRSLYLILWIILIFVIPYSFALRCYGHDGIWKIWLPNRIRRDLGDEEPTRLRLGGFSMITTALLFSVISSFRMGWKDVNVGDWISRIQSKEYTLQASGWVRTISGVQSLISAFLLATWLLTYFGRPFE